MSEIDTSIVEREISAIEAEAEAITIASQQDCQDASHFLQRVKAARKILDETFDGAIRQAHEAHKAIIAAKKKHDVPLSNAERTVKRLVADYAAEQDRKRREEEARLREIQRRADEEERLRRAAELEAEGKNEAAEAVVSAPPKPVAVVLPPQPKVEGVSVRTIWRYRIVDVDAIPRQWMIPDDKALAQHARSMGERAKVDGVEFYPDKSVATRAF